MDLPGGVWGVYYSLIFVNLYYMGVVFLAVVYATWLLCVLVGITFALFVTAGWLFVCLTGLRTFADDWT